MEVRNRSKELDLIDRVLDELWNEVRDIVQSSLVLLEEGVCYDQYILLAELY